MSQIPMYFIRREQVTSLVPLTELMRNLNWDAAVIWKKLDQLCPMFVMDPAPDIADNIRQNTPKTERLFIRNSKSGVFLLTNGLIADVCYNRIRYYSPLYGVFAKVWADRWTLTEAPK